MIIQKFKEVVIDNFKIIKPYFYSGRKRNLSSINTIVLHWTGGSTVDGAVTTLLGNNFGYHFLIDKYGVITQGSPLNRVVSHAGNSYGPSGAYVNGSSIGISFVVTGLKGSSEFTDAMYESCTNLILNIKPTLPNLKYITGHHWISPGRKIDPYTFNFSRLMKSIGSDLELWKTGYLPFPNKLSDCECIEFDAKGNCLKSIGGCKGPGNYEYSERRLSTEVNDFSFSSDMDSE